MSLIKKNRFLQKITQSCFVVTMVTALALFTSHSNAQNRLSIAEVKGGLHMITGPGGNIGVRITSEGVILIDDKFPQELTSCWKLHP